MVNPTRIDWKKKLFRMRSFFAAKLIKGVMKLLVGTCRFRMKGVQAFCEAASSKKCILMLWHNRLAIVPWLLLHYAPQLRYSALISSSRDGDILSMIVGSYEQGSTIRVPHHSRHQALRELIRHVETKQSVVVVTPDGPRGPLYEVKSGIALAALETGAEIVALDWEAERYWELKTWDRLRLPKPFTTIRATLSPPIRLERGSCLSLEEAKTLLKQSLDGQKTPTDSVFDR